MCVCACVSLSLLSTVTGRLVTAGMLAVLVCVCECVRAPVCVYTDRQRDRQTDRQTHTPLHTPHFHNFASLAGRTLATQRSVLVNPEVTHS